MRKLIITLISSALVVSFFIGFIDIAKKQTLNNDNVITYSVTQIPTDLKSVGGLNKRAQDIITATSRGLVELDENKEITPSLANSVDVKDDGLEYVFKIRDDIYWSDGSPITTKDIVMFFREILTEENEESIAALLNVFGAKSFRNGSGSFSNNVGISYNDDSIVFRLNSKDDKFIEELTMPQYRIRKNVLLWENIKKNHSDLIYSGYYTIKDITISELTLKKNNSIKVNIAETIKIIPYEEEEISMASFEIGGRDLVINPPKSQLDRLNSEGKLINLKSNRAMYLAFNPKNNSLNINGRKEIYRLLNEVFEDYESKNNMYVELAEASYFRTDKGDLEKLQTRKVMSSQETKWKNPEILNMIVLEGSENKEICDYVASWFEKNTDITIIYDFISEKELNSINELNYYDFALIQGSLTLSDETSIYNDLINFLDSDIHKEKLLLAKTEGDRLESFRSIEEDLFSSYRILPLIFYNDNIAVNTKIKKFKLDGNGNINFSEIQK